MKFEITYKLYDTRTGNPVGNNRHYVCKDAADYGRCVRLYKDGYVYLTSVNKRKITTQHNYPCRYTR